MISVLRSIVRELVEEGLLFLKDTDKDIYQVISFEKQLKSVLLTVMKASKLGAVLDPSNKSISLDSIVSKLQSMHEFQYVKRMKIIECLKLLEDDGVCYVSGFNSYKLTGL